AELGSALTQLFVEGDERRVVLVQRLHFLDRHDDGAEEALGGVVLQRRGALLALQQQLDATQAALNLADPWDDTHRVQNVGRRFVGVVPLCDGKDESVAFQRGLDRAQRARPAGRNGRREAWKYDGSSQRKNR